MYAKYLIILKAIAVKHYGYNCMKIQIDSTPE